MKAKPNRSSSHDPWRPSDGVRRAPSTRGAAGLSIDPSLNLTEAELRDGAAAFDAWHWGVKPGRVIDWNDSDMPRSLIECGRLVRFHVRVPRSASMGRHPRRQRDSMIEFSRKLSAGSHLAYDPSHPMDRLYCLIAPEGRAVLKQQLWDKNDLRPTTLDHLALLAGGKHGQMGGYPSIPVKPVGVAIAVIYQTEKKGDGLSFYIHRLGEITLTLPILAVDDRGRLWLAGGSTRAPTPGITD